MFEKENTIYFAYFRVSTSSQNLLRQYELIDNYLNRDNLTIHKSWEEKASGKNLERIQLQEMLEYFEGFYKIQSNKQAILLIESYSRLGRNMVDLLNLINRLRELNVLIVSINEPFNTSDPLMTNLLLALISSFSQMERETLLERQRAGIARAKAEGKYKGKGKKKVPDNFKFYLKKYLLRSAAFPYSLKQFKEDTKLKQGVLYRFINEFKEETINSIKKQSLNL